MTNLTQGFLREAFTYNEDMGRLVFNKKAGSSAEVKRWNTRYAGARAGSENNQGYLHVKLFGKKHKLHRLIFLYHHGWLPKVVDHKDGDKLNCRIDNLRPATTGENNRNSKVSSCNTSGVKGVSWHKQHGKWYASIRVNKRSIFLGLFLEKTEAEVAVRAARSKHHGEFANHG